MTDRNSIHVAINRFKTFFFGTWIMKYIVFRQNTVAVYLLGCCLGTNMNWLQMLPGVLEIRKLIIRPTTVCSLTTRKWP